MAVEIGKGLTPEFLSALQSSRNFIEKEHPLFRKLGLKSTKVSLGEVGFEVTLSVPFTDGGALHGSVFTIILDTILAFSVNARMNAFVPMATINLKTDHFSVAAAGVPINCHAVCEGIRDDVAFCSGKAVIAETGELIATAAGTFMLGTRSTRKASRL